MRHLLKTSMVLFLIFIFSGCEKSADLTLEPQQEEDSFATPFHEEINDTYLAIFQLISTSMRKAITEPQLFFLTEVGDTRNCPTSSVSGGTTYPKTMTLDFDNCNSAGIVYNGLADITFNAPLGQDAASGPEIVVPAVSGIMINGYTFDLTGPISLDRTPTAGGLFNYDFSLGGDIISTKNGTTTTLPSGSCGTFGIGFNDGDDPNNPITFVDNAFDVTLKQTEIVCQGSGAPHTFCTMTGEEALSLDPSACSCPTQGDLMITAGNCGSTGGAISNYDFGFDARNTDAGACDNFIDEVTIIDFLSYEGTITADGGAADGLTSIDIIVDEQPAPADGNSLQLTDGGTGASGHGFMWTNPTTASPGFLNVNQTISNTTTPSTPWINEIHYDDSGADADEGIEIAGPAGLDLSDYCLEYYNGSNDSPYGGRSLAGFTIPDEGNGFGAVWIPISGLQNGAPDGINLFRKDNVAAGFCSGR